MQMNIQEETQTRWHYRQV